MGGGPYELYRERYGAEILVMRKATKNDLDAITRVIQAGFPDDPGCNYKFPYRDKYPEDFWKYTRRQYEEYLEQPEKFAFNVVTVTNEEAGLDDLPIAIGVWDIAVHIKAKGGDLFIDERRDGNREHMKAYAAAMERTFARCFESYGKEQLHLWMLVTHPDFRRRGAGTRLCNWGVDESARRGGWILTVMASPMGRKLYEELGYVLVGTDTARVGGEEEHVVIDALEKPFSQHTI
ncbi:uncharacterized protein QC761_118050 [Podospora bellae-mahoneyi]|uniref:N-acetyltransferase domain-containing protein n=1 Tax=Podospora bellae-mahoneyi TaxID=2093777 RepID=A0ABR0G0X2_9PEZI|nr:hypothetical protein QC761_118050 [Podospora bellae-mahoneyi]